MLNETCTETNCFLNDVNEETNGISVNIKKREEQYCFKANKSVNNICSAECSKEDTNSIFIESVNDSNDVTSNEVNVKAGSINSSVTCQENRASALCAKETEYKNTKDIVNTLHEEWTTQLLEEHQQEEQEEEYEKLEYLPQKHDHEVESTCINLCTLEEDEGNCCDQCQLQGYINEESEKTQTEEQVLHEEYIEMNYDEEIETSMQYYNNTLTSIPYQHELQDEWERCEYEEQQENENSENLASVHNCYSFDARGNVENKKKHSQHHHHRNKKLFHDMSSSDSIRDDNNKTRAFCEHAKEKQDLWTLCKENAMTKCDVLNLDREECSCNDGNDADYLHDELPTDEMWILEKYNINDDNQEEDEEKEECNAYVIRNSTINKVSNSSWRPSNLHYNYIHDTPLQQSEKATTLVDFFVTANSEQLCNLDSDNKVKHKRCKTKNDGAEVPFSAKWLQRQAEIMKKHKVECHRRWLEEMANPASVNSSLSSLTISSSSSSSSLTTATTSTTRANASNIREVVTLDEVKQFTYNIKILLNTACRKDLTELRRLPASCFGNCTPSKLMMETCVSSCLAHPQKLKETESLYSCAKKTSNNRNHEFDEQKTFYISYIKNKWKELAFELNELCQKLIDKTSCSQTYKKEHECQWTQNLVCKTSPHSSALHVDAALNSKAEINKAQFLEDKKSIVLKIFSLFIFGKSREFTVETAESLREARNKRKMSLIKRLNESKQLFELPILYGEEEEVLPHHIQPDNHTKATKINGSLIPCALNTCFLGESLYTTQKMENKKETKKFRPTKAIVNDNTSDDGGGDDNMTIAKVVLESVQYRSNDESNVHDDDNKCKTKILEERQMKNTTCITDHGNNHEGSKGSAHDEDVVDDDENGLSLEKSTRMKLVIDEDDNESGNGVANGDISPNGLSPSSTTSSGDDAEDENYENNYCEDGNNIHIVCTNDTKLHPNVLTTSQIAQIMNSKNTFTISSCGLHTQMPSVTLCKVEKSKCDNVNSANGIINSTVNVRNTATSAQSSSYKALFDFLYTVVSEQYDIDDTCNTLKHIR